VLVAGLTANRVIEISFWNETLVRHDGRDARCFRI
jgi:hypothetical protein